MIRKRTERSLQDKIVHFIKIKWIFLLFLTLVVTLFLIKEPSFYLLLSLGVISFLVLFHLTYSLYAKRDQVFPNFLVVVLDILSLNIIIFLNKGFILEFAPYLYSLLIIEDWILRNQKGSFFKGSFFLTTFFSILYLLIASFSLEGTGLRYYELRYYEVIPQVGFLYLVSFLLWYLSKQKEMVLQEKNALIDNLYHLNKILAKDKNEIETYNQSLEERLKSQSIMINQDILKDEKREIIGVIEAFNDISKFKEMDEADAETNSLLFHELKTSLTIIKGYVAVLLSEKLGKITQAQRNRLTRIEQQVNSLNNMSNNLLELPKIGLDKISLEKVSLSKIIRETVDIFKEEFKKKELDFKLKEDQDSYYILGDEPSLERVFVNLIDNAIKYTPFKGKIRLELKGGEDEIKVYLTNTGLGILPEELPKVFDKFFRSSLVSKDEKGIGLGLNIVKKILDLHQALIEVSSEVNKSSQFCLRFKKIRVK
ncbi:HAMP domain-containing histidine kinase [bacterium]|nr:HAMP domain-containing histidine kinase [bacterium]MBU1152657.1 HAMP domain-containing histidine kinase [bacterium]